MARIKTAEKTLIFDLALSNGDDYPATGLSFYLDLAQCLSLVNRVSMRQGYEYAVQSLEIGCQSGGSFTASVYRLPEHWPCINAWEKTMRHWLEQQNDAARDAGLESTRAAYRDFKIFFDGDHAQTGTGANLIPSGYSTLAPLNGSYDWNPSQVVVPNYAGTPGNTQEFFLHMLGDDQSVANKSKGMIRAYAESRSRPYVLDPNIVDVSQGGLFGEMEDTGEIMEDVVDNFQEHNNEPPYLLDGNSPDEYYPGGVNQGIGPLDGAGDPKAGALMDILSINANQNYNSDTMGGFIAPCGLIKFDIRASGVATPSPVNNPGQPFSAFWLKVVLAPGEYKGVMARSMQEVN